MYHVASTYDIIHLYNIQKTVWIHVLTNISTIEIIIRYCGTDDRQWQG